MYSSPSEANPLQSAGTTRSRSWRFAMESSKDAPGAMGRSSTEVEGAWIGALVLPSPDPLKSPIPPATNSTAARPAAVPILATLFIVPSPCRRDHGTRPGGAGSRRARIVLVRARVRTRARVCEVRERCVEREVVRTHSVTQGEGGRLRVRQQHAEDRAQRYVDDVVGQPATVRETGVVSADHAERVAGGARTRRDRHVQAELLGRGPVGGLVQPGNTRE